MRKNAQFALVLAALMVLTACGKKDNAEPAFVANAEKAQGGGSASTKEPSKDFNVGDAESAFNLNLELDPESKSDTVTEVKILTSKKLLSEATVTVKDPTLQHLWIRIRVEPTAAFTQRVAALRGVLDRDNQPLVGFKTVLGKYALEKPTAGVVLPPKEFRVDVLQGLAQRPASILLLAKTEVLLAAKGADEAVIDPETLKADPGDISAKISNPLRINFETAAAPAPAPAETPAPAATPAPTPAPAPAQ